MESEQVDTVLLGVSQNSLTQPMVCCIKVRGRNVNVVYGSNMTFAWAMYIVTTGHESFVGGRENLLKEEGVVGVIAGMLTQKLSVLKRCKNAKEFSDEGGDTSFVDSSDTVWLKVPYDLVEFGRCKINLRMKLPKILGKLAENPAFQNSIEQYLARTTEPQVRAFFRRSAQLVSKGGPLPLCVSGPLDDHREGACTMIIPDSVQLGNVLEHFFHGWLEGGLDNNVVELICTPSGVEIIFSVGILTVTCVHKDFGQHAIRLNLNDLDENAWLTATGSQKVKGLLMKSWADKQATQQAKGEHVKESYPVPWSVITSKSGLLRADIEWGKSANKVSCKVDEVREYGEFVLLPQSLKPLVYVLLNLLKNVQVLKNGQVPRLRLKRTPWGVIFICESSIIEVEHRLIQQDGSTEQECKKTVYDLAICGHALSTALENDPTIQNSIAMYNYDSCKKFEAWREVQFTAKILKQASQLVGSPLNGLSIRHIAMVAAYTGLPCVSDPDIVNKLVKYLNKNSDIKKGKGVVANSSAPPKVAVSRLCVTLKGTGEPEAKEIEAFMLNISHLRSDGKGGDWGTQSEVRPAAICQFRYGDPSDFELVLRCKGNDQYEEVMRHRFKVLDGSTLKDFLLVVEKQLPHGMQEAFKKCSNLEDAAVDITFKDGEYTIDKCKSGDTIQSKIFSGQEATISLPMRHNEAQFGTGDASLFSKADGVGQKSNQECPSKSTKASSVDGQKKINLSF